MPPQHARPRVKAVPHAIFAVANAAKHSDASRIDITDRVEALGGSIRVSSRPGKGTQITPELPLELELPRPVG